MRNKNELYLTPRMFCCEWHPFNSVEGLQQLIGDCLTPESVMVEIGSFAGVSSELFAQHCQQVTCIDIWDSDPGHPGLGQEVLKQARDMFEIVRNGYSNIEMIQCYGRQALHLIQEQSLDLIYIDASHHYESVKEDIALWTPKVRNEGWITGHDYYWEGVAKAVNEVSSEIRTYPDDSWAFKNIGR